MIFLAGAVLAPDAWAGVEVFHHAFAATLRADWFVFTVPIVIFTVMFVGSP